MSNTKQYQQVINTLITDIEVILHRDRLSESKQDITDAIEEEIQKVRQFLRNKVLESRLKSCPFCGKPTMFALTSASQNIIPTCSDEDCILSDIAAGGYICKYDSDVDELVERFNKRVAQ